MAMYAKTKINITSVNPSEITLNYSEKEINAEYSRLRKVALKRLKRLENSKDFSAPKYAEFHRHEWATIAELGNVGNVAKSLTSLTKFLNMKGSLVTEQMRMRKERREYLETEILGTPDNPRRFRNYKEMELFDDFLDYMSNKYDDNFYYDIDNVIDLFNDYSQYVIDGSMSLDEFAEIYEGSYDADVITITPNKKKRRVH